MSTYRLFSWGANSHGQLGLGDISEDELPIPKEVDLTLADVQVNKIKKIVGGAGHSLILDDNGCVFSCGWNDKGQAGIEKQESIKRFQKIDDLDSYKIIDIACGWDSSMALTDRGELFAWGSNLHGQLGLAEIRSTCTPIKVELEVPVKKMSIGLRHSAIVNQNHEVLVSGAATKGQLGVDLADGEKSIKRFVKVPNLPRVKDVSCGQHHTVVTTVEDDVFAWGDNKHGQLGVDPDSHRISLKPVKVDDFKKIGAISKIHCGWTHTVILNSNKKLQSWGRNAYGQLGRAKTTPLNELWKADTALSIQTQQISVGSEHNVALTDDGTVMSWGWNEHGNCGNGSKDDVFEPTNVLLPENSIGILVGSGAGHSFAIVKTKSDL